jgi:hypothetical protein
MSINIERQILGWIWIMLTQDSERLSEDSRWQKQEYVGNGSRPLNRIVRVAIAGRNAFRDHSAAQARANLSILPLMYQASGSAVGRCSLISCMAWSGDFPWATRMHAPMATPRCLPFAQWAYTDPPLLITFKASCVANRKKPMGIGNNGESIHGSQRLRIGGAIGSCLGGAPIRMLITSWTPSSCSSV